jgi:hypothetical protein
MTRPLVEVLMSTYNGERFVAEQVDSILRQTYQPLRLLVRDDGSADQTLDILRHYDDSRVLVRAGSNLGLPDAFFRIMDDSSDDAEFWSLADQDDVWEPNKIERAVAALEPLGDEPSLFCGRVLVVDEGLKPLYPHELPKRGPSFANALVQNIALGCTIVINRAARDLLRETWPRECVMHDAWMYLVLAGAGRVLYDEECLVLYRQHARNAVGMGRGPLSRMTGRVRRQLLPGGPGRHGRQDVELARLFGELLTPRAQRELQDFLSAQASPAARLRYAACGPAHRQAPVSNLILKGLLALGRV